MKSQVKSQVSSIRLQKFIADCGVTSRRKAEGFMLQGRVSVNGEIVTELGTKIHPQNDTVLVDGEILDLQHVNKMYMVMNKPRGVMTTLNDPEGRPTVMDLCKEISERIYPVGRLDYLSEGLLLLTNDGEFANMVMHPKFEIMKVYEVKVFGIMNENLLKKLAGGVEDPEVGFIKPKSVRVIKQLPTKTWLEFRLNDGKNREIRRLCDALGITIDKLRRVAIHGLSVDGIAPGKYRLMTKRKLMEALGLGDNKIDNKIGNKKDDKKKDATKISRFVSSKRTIDLKRKGVQKGVQGATPADSEAFHKFKKESYYTSLKAIAQTKQKALEMAQKEAFEAKEKAHEARKYKKNLRIQKKEENQKYVHAKFIK